jgi:hypothetical protein
MSSERISESQAHELAIIDAIVRGGGEARPEDAALTDFVLLVRNARPLPDHGEVAALDARVTKALPIRRRRERVIFRPVFAGLCALLLLIGVVGAAYVQRGSETAGSSTADRIMAAKAGSSADAAETGEAQLAQSASSLVAEPDSIAQPGPSLAPSVDALPAPGIQKSVPSSARGADRSVAWSAELILAASGGEIPGLGERVNEVTNALGGYVADSSERVLDNDRGAATFSLMIPAFQREEAVRRLSRLAHVRSREQSSEDIANGANAAERDLKRLTARVKSLEVQLAATKSAAQRASLGAELSGVEARRRAVLRDVRTERGRVNYVPIKLIIAADSKAGDQEKGTLGKAIVAAGKILTGALAGLIIVCAALVPLMLIVLAVWLGWRARGRRRSARALDAAASPHAE